MNASLPRLFTSLLPEKCTKQQMIHKYQKYDFCFHGNQRVIQDLQPVIFNFNCVIKLIMLSSEYCYSYYVPQIQISSNSHHFKFHNN